MQVVHPEQSDHFMPYAPGIIVAAGRRTLYLSGCTALPLYHAHPHVHEELDPPDDIAEQTRLALDNIGKVLKAAGANFEHIVRADISITDMDEQDRMQEVIREYFRGQFPTSTLVEVRRLVVSGLKVEINCIAELPD